MRRIARERKQKYLSKKMDDHHRLLVPNQKDNHWSMSFGKYRFDRMPALVTGKEVSKRDSGAYRMRKHIKNSSLQDAMYPINKRDGAHFNPVDVPLLDTLVMEADQEYGWKIPSKEVLQEFWGLGPRMLKKCEVKEITLNGNQTEEEQLAIVSGVI